MDQSRDDLSRIDGIGPFIEKKLNDANVYTFEQIASWSDADIKIITQRIQYFEGRIEKDNWIGQAKILVDAPPLEPNNEETTTLDSNNNDDLKVIEGIGPKIESILKSAGITSLEQLAKSDPADLQLILEQNEAHYHMHDSTTWPAQARLAANGDWDVLEDYQDELIGGREPNDVD
jgi:predicted flap endonuclease-1-like 5' DNA nuclease